MNCRSFSPSARSFPIPFSRLVEISGFEPLTPLLAKQALSRLSYTPKRASRDWQTANEKSQGIKLI